ncbi:putative transcriptional regulatory protein C1F7.11c [Hypsizygus marmoreus]|uniref:Transcriptional regulatory protein C1F7.11c n=1 Tax=Hypsizygus marmoreus TaxID=39966 RepID=A0A369J8P4_HYPMA|nr:putative transcriptional regulatory protein C1F7.11c [Hypsizygus marmoreus]
MPSSPSSDKRMDIPGSQGVPVKKRRKGATRLSCAECRRLKLRCDRTIPCGSCVKRGCGAICPDGSLTTGQGNRFVLASTQELHAKIEELATRVRQLEDALRSSHSHLSSEPHPLLSEELLRIKAPLQREPAPHRNNSTNPVKEEEQNPDVVDAFGSLSISLSGRTKYFGHIANSWYFLQNESPEEDDQADHLATLRSILPAEILKRASAFPITPVNLSSDSERARLQDLFWYLPPAEKALELRSIYYSHAAWMYNPISFEAFDTQVYRQFYDPSAGPSSEDSLLSHRLSLMFMVLAIGSLMNTSLPAYNLEAEKYHQLARAALFYNSLFEEPTINAVQALYLMTFYLFLADRHGTVSGARWAIMGIAVKVGQSIGLHRDSGRWKIDAVETQQRRELFWELFTYDSWQCLTFGRPPSFALPHVDCKLPFTNDTSDEQTFHAWKHRFASECMNLFHDQAFGAKMPTYATVLQLDRKMRAFPVPPLLQVAGFGSSETRPGGFPETIMLTLQRHIVLAIREMNLLYLHRSFFARAISDHPKDPLGSPYGTSVIAAYRSAGSLVALMRNLHTQLHEPSERLWFLWTHMFSCAIVLGSIVTRCPSMSLAPSALVQLDSACELFSKAARGFRAGKILNIMLNLREKAHFSLEEFKNGRGSPLTKYNMSSAEPPTPVEDDDELSILGGKTRLVAKKEPSSPTILERSPTSQNPVVPLPLSPSMQGHVHPSVWEYLDSFTPQNHNHNQSPVHRHNSASSAGGSSSHNSFSEEVSPVSMYGMSTLPTSPTFQTEPSSYIPHSQQQYQQSSPTHQFPQQQQQQQQHLPHAPQGTIMGGMQSPVTNGSTSQTFPQYFPVYDYGNGMVNGGVNGINGFGSAPMLDANPLPPGHRRSSGSPEGNMQSTWQDFVADFTM